MSMKHVSKKSVCISRFSDLSVAIAEDFKGLSVGSSDPYSDSFCPLAYLSSVFLSKHPSLDSSNSADTRRSLAIAKLFASDSRCKAINDFGFVNASFDAFELNGLLKTAQSLIGNLLIGFDRHYLDDVNFSNGASQGFKLQDAAPFKKFAGQATVTAPAYSLAVESVKSDPTWYSYMLDAYGDESLWFRRVYGNGLFTVPKNSEIDRAACKEPDMNMYLQKAAGSFIRSRLKTVGIDLNDQRLNQNLAQIGSIDGSLCTLDLSSASDSITDRLVWELLPPSVYSYLDLIRSHYTKSDDGFYRWSLFSTMGNGFTFELESLIFWALARATMIHNGVTGLHGVYGDDIIVPSSCAVPLIKLLETVGFTINHSKSFTTGFFRESCGAHYFKGIDVKPFYIKAPIDHISPLLLFLNRLRGWGTAIGMADPRLYPIWLKYSELVPSYLKGGCDLMRSDYLCTLDYPRKRLSRRSKVQSGFNFQFASKDENGRLIAWHHVGSGEIIQTLVTDRWVLKPNSEWCTTTVAFPQECNSSVLT